MAGNPEQLRAARVRSHCVVLAGPGSGKTKTLTTAMARALLEDVEEPRGVACITYNNECAIELETRLALLGIEPSDRVFIGTVHSFAMAQVVGPYARIALPDLQPGFRVATTDERRKAVDDAYRATLNQGEDPQRRWGFAEAKRRRDVDRTQVAWMGRNPELARFIEDYERRLHEQGLIDFDDMPLLAYRLVRDQRWIRDALRAKFPILYVDEYQDLGHALHELVLSLCFDAGMRLFAVGDTDQSIYAFTGANPELLDSLTNREDVETVRLRFNYRSGSKIINASMAALGEERGYEAAEGAAESTIGFRGVPGDLSAQAEFVSKALIPELRGRGVPLEEIAVLYRNANLGSLVADAAMAEGIPVVRSDNQALVRRGSRLSRFVEACAAWSAGGWEDADPPFHRLSRDATALVYAFGASDDERRQLELELVQFLRFSIGGDPLIHDWLQEFREEIVRPWRARARTPEDEWGAVDEMITRTQAGANEASLTRSTFSGRIVGTGRLNLSTLHSAKGREFDVAIMFGMNRDEMPTWRESQNEQRLREARRLFYVGVTRPRRELYLVYQKGGHSAWVKELHDRASAA